MKEGRYARAPGYSCPLLHSLKAGTGMLFQILPNPQTMIPLIFSALLLLPNPKGHIVLDRSCGISLGSWNTRRSCGRLHTSFSAVSLLQPPCKPQKGRFFRTCLPAKNHSNAVFRYIQARYLQHLNILPSHSLYRSCGVYQFNPSHCHRILSTFY